MIFSVNCIVRKCLAQSDGCLKLC